MAAVRGAGSDDISGSVAVLAALPDYFSVQTHRTLAAEMRIGRSWVAEDDSGEVCGIVQVMARNAKAAEITFAAVLPQMQRRGIGQALVARALVELHDIGVAMVEVKTLDASSGYQPYVGTRAFWESQGFVQIDVIDPLPGWEPGNPSAIYVAALQRTALGPSVR
jgi:N-acetylglutamate synthase-like GNAT family acetyltransferase